MVYLTENSGTTEVIICQYSDKIIDCEYNLVVAQTLFLTVLSSIVYVIHFNCS